MIKFFLKNKMFLFFNIVFLLSLSLISKFILNDKYLFINEFFLIFLAMICYRWFHFFKDMKMKEASQLKSKYQARLATYMPIFSAGFSFLLFLIVVLKICYGLGVDITPFLAALSIFGAAIGLSAKDAIQSFLHGIIFLVEKNVYVNDVIQFKNEIGIVEKLSLRLVTIRKSDDSFCIIPYNLMDLVIIYSKNDVYISDFIEIKSYVNTDLILNIFDEVTSFLKESEEYCDKIFGHLNIKILGKNMKKIHWELHVVPGFKGSNIKNDVNKKILELFSNNGI